MARRDMGKLVFLDLVDRCGRIQLLCPPARTGEVDVHLGDVVGAIGKPAKSRRGEPSLSSTSSSCSRASARRYPDTFHGLTDVEQRYRRRYLDLLMNEETRADFLLRSRMVTRDPPLPRRRGLRRGRDAGAAAALRRRVRAPFVTHSNELDQDLYLRIATELYLKRLIVGGLEKVYEIGSVFRNEGVSYKHNPEFTMLEWYEAYADYRDTMERFETLVETVALETLGTTKVTYRGHEIDLKRPWRRVKLVDALAEHGVWSQDDDELRAHPRGTRHRHDRRTTRGRSSSTSAHELRRAEADPADVPLRLSGRALTVRADRPTTTTTIVERFEGFVGGTELCNAFSELNDSVEQAARFAMQAEEGAGGNIEAEPGDPDYVEALSYGMPPTGGLGFGIDRLAMVLAGKDSVRDVMLFPAQRSESVKSAKSQAGICAVLAEFY